MSSFTVMFFLGVGLAIIGAASRNIGLSPYQIGLLFWTQNIGFTVSVITDSKIEPGFACLMQFDILAQIL